MIGHLSLEELIDADFSRARRKALLRRVRARLRGGAAADALLCFDEVRKNHGVAVGRVYLGMRTVPVARIVGSVGRCSEFDGGFMPARTNVKGRWKRMDLAFHRGEELPPVILYKVMTFYFVLDGHHRVSVASYHGVEWIDAHVTEFSASGLRSERRDRGARIESPANGMEEPSRCETITSEVTTQRYEELLREAEPGRQTRSLREIRKRCAGRGAALAWEPERRAGRLLESSLRVSRKVGREREMRYLPERVDARARPDITRKGASIQ